MKYSGMNPPSSTSPAGDSETHREGSFAPTPEFLDFWSGIHDRMRAEFGETVYRSWLRHLTLQACYHGILEVAVPTRFMRDWVQNHYARQILDMCCRARSDVKRIEIVVSQTQIPPASSVGTLDSSEESPDSSEGISAADRSESPLAGLTQLDARFTFETFVTGQSNALAHAAARRVVESDSLPFNPLFIYGGVGLGKTHLMQAMAWEIRRQSPARQVVYMSAEGFMYQFVRALRSRETIAFKELFRSVDVLMIDDIQFISGKDSTQEEFFHTFNALIDQNKQIVISGDKSPSDLAAIDERLRSRLSWGLVADIQPTTYDLRLGILNRKLEAMSRSVPESVLELLALKITSNVRELEGALNRIVAHAELTGQPVTLETTRHALMDLLRAHDRRITIDEIQRRVAEHYSINLSEMHSARRARSVARPRQVAMYLSKHLTARSLPEIGRRFGGRDHTTVMHAVRKIEEIMQADLSFAEDVEVLRRALTG